ncbi:hypothetical protein ACTFIY_005844 [Dictyostelium cf. discoideum]
MESLLPQFNTISLIHPMSSATSHLLEQRQFLSTQPLVIEFEGVWDDDDESEDTLDQELNFYNNNFKQIQNNNNNNNNNNNIISNEINNINNYQIENITKHLKKLEKEGHIKIPKSLNSHKSRQSGFQIKKNSFIRDKKLISISNTMKNNMFHCLIK